MFYAKNKLSPKYFDLCVNLVSVFACHFVQKILHYRTIKDILFYTDGNLIIHSS